MADEAPKGPRQDARQTPDATEAAPPAQQPLRQVPDAEFAPFRDGYMKENERLNNKFDDVIKSLQDAIADPFPEDLAKREERLRARYDELRLRVSELRRAGKDMLIPSLVLRQFPAKIALAHATREPKDYEIARILLEQAQYEIDEANTATVVDVRKDVMRMAGLDAPAPAAQPAPLGTLKKEQVK